jgi:hypothetical protein
MPSSPRQHDLGQPVPDWSPATVPDKTFLSGHYCRLEPLTRAHGKDLLDAFRADDDGVIWDYLPYGPFDNLPAFEAFLELVVWRQTLSSMRSSTPGPAGLSAWRVTCVSPRRKA